MTRRSFFRHFVTKLRKLPAVVAVVGVEPAVGEAEGALFRGGFDAEGIDDI